MRITTTESIIPNLIPDAWDVDLDEVGSSGLQFEPKNLGDEFDVSVTINAQLGVLITFNLEIYFDHEDMEVISCTNSGAWADKMFESSIDDSVGQILLAGYGGTLVEASIFPDFLIF